MLGTSAEKIKIQVQDMRACDELLERLVEAQVAVSGAGFAPVRAFEYARILSTTTELETMARGACIADSKNHEILGYAVVDHGENKLKYHTVAVGRHVLVTGRKTPDRSTGRIVKLWIKTEKTMIVEKPPGLDPIKKKIAIPVEFETPVTSTSLSGGETGFMTSSSGWSDLVTSARCSPTHSGDKFEDDQGTPVKKCLFYTMSSPTPGSPTTLVSSPTPVGLLSITGKQKCAELDMG
jgi:hypothetical protein